MLLTILTGVLEYTFNCYYRFVWLVRLLVVFGLIFRVSVLMLSLYHQHPSSVWCTWYISFKMSLFSVYGLSLDWTWHLVSWFSWHGRVWAKIVLYDLWRSFTMLMIPWSFDHNVWRYFPWECYGTWLLLMSSISTAIIVQLLFHTVLLTSFSAEFPVFPTVCCQ